MLCLIISDVHANLAALDAVLADAAPFDCVVSLGDHVGYGPNPNEVVDRVRSLPNLTALAGNHDLAAIGVEDPKVFSPLARIAIEWTATQMDTDKRDYLRDLQTTGRTASASDEESSPIFLAHASPRDPVWEYLEDAWQGPPNFAVFEQLAAFVGHTHMPKIFEDGPEGSRIYVPRINQRINLGTEPRKIVNPGSVGQPRDHNPDAAYGMLDLESGDFTFRRIAYDIADTSRQILEAGLPAQLAHRLPLGM